MILTPLLRILPCDDTVFDAIRMGDGVLARVLGANVPKKWTESRDSFAPSAIRWKAHPPLQEWWVHLIVYRPDNMLVGSCGYKGEPDAEGCVEIGYEVKASHRGKGLATEAARGLVEHAFTFPEVVQVLAHTMPEENHSTRILEKLGFQRTGEVHDPTDGLVWRWTVNRTTYQPETSL